MKKIEAVLRPQNLDEVVSALSDAGFPGVMITEIEGHGRQKGITQQWRGQEYRMDLLPKVKVEVVCEDKEAEEIISMISKVAKTGEIGDGKIFVSDIKQVVRIRTGERGEPALT
jgi:nitrogen regulatory protein P-II 1